MGHISIMNLKCVHGDRFGAVKMRKCPCKFDKIESNSCIRFYKKITCKYRDKYHVTDIRIPLWDVGVCVSGM